MDHKDAVMEQHHAHSPGRVAKKVSPFFSFADPGGYVWWASIIFGAVGAACLAAIVIVVVNSARGTTPQAVFDFLESRACPALSPLVAEPQPFTGWLPSCRVVRTGATYPCYTYVDCIMLSSECAQPSLLSRMTCEPPRDGGNRGDQSVCQLSIGPRAGSPVLPLPVGGFCPQQGLRCAWCAEPWRCSALAGCVANERCNSTSTPSVWQCTGSQAGVL